VKSARKNAGQKLLAEGKNRRKPLVSANPAFLNFAVSGRRRGWVSAKLSWSQPKVSDLRLGVDEWHDLF
jgi:hypothetical protein